MKRGYKFCGYQGCRRLVKDSRHTYCPECTRKEADRRRKAMTRSLGSYGRRWRNLRNAYLAANPLCERCGALGEEVDHLQPHRGERHLLLDSDNLWSLCRRCHREITQWELTCGLADPLMPDAKKALARQQALGDLVD